MVARSSKPDTVIGVISSAAENVCSALSMLSVEVIGVTSI